MWDLGASVGFCILLHTSRLQLICACLTYCRCPHIELQLRKLEWPSAAEARLLYKPDQGYFELPERLELRLRQLLRHWPKPVKALHSVHINFTALVLEAVLGATVQSPRALQLLSGATHVNLGWPDEGSTFLYVSGWQLSL